MRPDIRNFCVSYWQLNINCLNHPPDELLSDDGWPEIHVVLIKQRFDYQRRPLVIITCTQYYHAMPATKDKFIRALM